MKMQVSLFKKCAFIFTIMLLTLGALGNLSYGETVRSQIYWTDLGTLKIQRANLDGTNIQDIVTAAPVTPLGVALDVNGGKMYWVDWFFTGSIRQANLDGTNVQDIITEGLENPWNIALDVAGEKIYWADIVTGKIQCANLDGSNIQDIVTGLDKPWDIALDVAGQKIYWTDRDADKIQRANLDGTNIQDIIITEGLENPWNIALDVAGQKIYWTSSGKIQRANLDGSNVEGIITEGLDEPRDIALDVAGGKMYWTHAEYSAALDAYTNGKVQRANLDGSNVEDIVTGLERPAGIALGFDIPYQPPAPDSGNTLATATPLALDTPYTEAIDSIDDVDYFRIEVDQSGELVVYTTGELDTMGELLTGDGARLDDDDDGGDGSNFRIVYSVTPGTYYVKVREFWGNTGNYTVHASFETDQFALNVRDTLEAATLLALDTPYTEAIDSIDDVDYFRIEVDQSGELTVYTTGYMDTGGELLTEDGTRLADDDDSGSSLNFRIVYSVDPGTYYVKVQGIWGSTGSYTVQASLETGKITAPDETAPEVISSYPENGAADVDPEDVFEDGIEVVFTEPVSGDLMLLDADYDDVGWVSTTDGDTITLTGIAGSELGNETEYTIGGIVSDAAGNETEVYITFTTSALETAVNADGLVAYWAFNEASGATARDASGNGHDGTLLGSPKRTAGRFGGAITFDGIDDKVVVPYHRALNPETFSICFWVNVAPSSTGYRAPVSCRNYENGGTSGYNFYVHPDNVWQLWIGTGEQWNWVSSPEEVGFGQWEHITGVYTDGFWNLYVNGELSTRAYESTLRLNVNTMQEFLIGAGANEMATHNFYFKGMIDEVRVYNRALDTAEIALVMETGVTELPTGPKIEGPWLWMLVPTNKAGNEAAVGPDYLAEASGGTVTETAIATEGARSGDFVGNRRWTPGRISPTGRNNINDLMNAIGLATGNVDYHVAYGSIVLDVPHEQETLMYVGSDDSVKVWLNGDLVHHNPVNRGAASYQDSFPVTLKEGENILLVAVYEGWAEWAGFFGFKTGTVYTLLPPVMSEDVSDAGDTIETATALALDTHYTDTIFSSDDVDYYRIEVEQSGELTVYTTGDLDTIGQLLTENGEVLATGDDEGEFLNFQIVYAALPGTYYVSVAGFEGNTSSALGYIIYATLELPQLTTDINGDGVVDIRDLVLVAGAFGETGDHAADVNGDDVVDIRDLVLVASAFGETSAAPAAQTLSILTPQIVQQWLTASKLIDEKSAAYQRGILILERLLGALTPKKTALLANYPNPFNPETWIPYQLAKPADVALHIYAADGKLVRTLDLGHQPVGIYQSRSRAAYWDGKNALGEPVASGVYFYTLTAGEFTATRKMLIRK